MSVRLQSILADFAERGITADKMSADEIEALVFAVERANNPYSAVNAELLEEPVRVSAGVWLWPMTAGAQIWLEEYAGKWWPKKSSAMHRWAHVYALMHAREPGAFPTDRRAARTAILRSMLRVCCHRRELAVAMNKCYRVGLHDAERDARPSSRPDEQANGFAKFVAELEVKSGIPASAWLWGKSLLETLDQWKRMRRLSDALGGGGGDMDFELDAALENLALVKSRIVERMELAEVK